MCQDRDVYRFMFFHFSLLGDEMDCTLPIICISLVCMLGTHGAKTFGYY